MAAAFVGDSLSSLISNAFTMQILPVTKIWIWVLLYFISSTVAPDIPSISTSLDSTSLLNAFRAHYAQFLAVVTQVHTEPTDSFLLQLLGEDLNQFAHLAHEVSGNFWLPFSKLLTHLC